MMVSVLPGSGSSSPLAQTEPVLPSPLWMHQQASNRTHGNFSHPQLEIQSETFPASTSQQQH